MRREERQWSHCRHMHISLLFFVHTGGLREKGKEWECTFSFRSASETGFAGRDIAAGGGIEVSGILGMAAFPVII